MAVTVVPTSCLVGIDAEIISVEVNLERGLPRFEIVGLPDNSIKESRTRVSTAIKNSCGNFPIRSITVNLSPANIHKHGTGFDLPIALGVLAAAGIIPTKQLDGCLAIGELSLRGQIRPVIGVLAAAQAAKKAGFEAIICAPDNAAEAVLLSGIKVYQASSLVEIISKFSEHLQLPLAQKSEVSTEYKSYELDLTDIKGQEKGKRALEIAAAGGHHLLYIGPPGSGKTMLAKRLPSILPKLDIEQAIEVAKIYSAAGFYHDARLNFGLRPYREPHHNISNAGLIGGGTNPKPGEISLAHHGALFLDEFAEFPPSLLDLLRQPLENCSVIISRSKLTTKFPCDFQLIAATNPCPCGHLGDSNRRCKCNPNQVAKYVAKLSGPIMDRIDLQVELPNLSYKQLTDSKLGIDSNSSRKNVIQAVIKQTKRFGEPKRNASMSHKEILKYIPLDQAGKKFMEQAMNKWKFSNRAHDRILKISRTIADLSDCREVNVNHLAEAFNYRCLDKQAAYAPN